MAYSNDRLSRIKIPVSELKNSLYCCEKVDFCIFRPNASVDVKIDLSVIYKSLYRYIYPVHIEEDKVYGIDVYNVLKDSIQDIVSRANEEGEGVNLRPFRLLWEHKKMWKERIAKLNGLFLTAYEIENEIEIIENKARIIFMLALKYQITWRNSILQRIMNYLKEIEVKDKVWSHAVLEVIGKSLN